MSDLTSVWLPWGTVYNPKGDYPDWSDVELDPEDPSFGWFETQEECQEECLRREAKFRTTLRVRYDAYVAGVEKSNRAKDKLVETRLREHEVLVRAGLRGNSFARPARPVPEQPRTFEQWSKWEAKESWSPLELKKAGSF